MSETETKVEEKSGSVGTQDRQRTESEGHDSNPDIHFEPIVDLPLVDMKTLEENETELLKVRAKLYRYDTTEDVPQFKERGTGEVKLMKHKEIRAVRILMRRDKTLKLCANHYIMPSMELKKHQNSDKVFVWSTFADLSDETPKPETLAIRFGTVENAQKFKEVFEESVSYVTEVGRGDAEDIANKLTTIHIKSDENDEKDSDGEDRDSDDEKDESEDKEVNGSEDKKDSEDKE